VILMMTMCSLGRWPHTRMSLLRRAVMADGDPDGLCVVERSNWTGTDFCRKYR
jgi:hypothetical protein